MSDEYRLFAIAASYDGGKHKVVVRKHPIETGLTIETTGYETLSRAEVAALGEALRVLAAEDHFKKRGPYR